MAHLTRWRHIYLHRAEPGCGKIQNSAPTSHHSDGTPMASKPTEAIHLQRPCFGRDQVKWARDIRPLHLSGVTTASQFQVESNSNRSETAGSFQLHLQLLNNRSASTDSSITKNTIRMEPSDSISGSRMPGTVSTLTTDCQAHSMEAGSDPGPPSAHTPRPGGCHFWRRPSQN